MRFYTKVFKHPYITTWAFTREQIGSLPRPHSRIQSYGVYRSFVNLSEGKAVCFLEAPDKEAVAAWFEKMKMGQKCCITQMWKELSYEQRTVHSLSMWSTISWKRIAWRQYTNSSTQDGRDAPVRSLRWVKSRLCGDCLRKLSSSKSAQFFGGLRRTFPASNII